MLDLLIVFDRLSGVNQQMPLRRWIVHYQSANRGHTMVATGDQVFVANTYGSPHEVFG